MTQTLVIGKVPTPSFLNPNTVLPFATSIEAIRVFNNTIQVTYWTSSGRCSTFLSKKVFKPVDIDKPLQVGDVVKIKSDRHGEFFHHLPALVKTNDSSVGVVVEVMGQKRFFYHEELVLVRGGTLVKEIAQIDPENLPKGFFIQLNSGNGYRQEYKVYTRVVERSFNESLS